MLSLMFRLSPIRDINIIIIVGAFTKFAYLFPFDATCIISYRNIIIMFYTIFQSLLEIPISNLLSLILNGHAILYSSIHSWRSNLGGPWTLVYDFSLYSFLWKRDFIAF
ncbi:hypothetical protein ACJX0J_021089, partial [Zea mays]